MQDLVAFLLPVLGLAALVIAIVRFRVLEAREGGLAQAMRNETRDAKLAVLALFVGVSLLAGWWVLFLQPAGFPWQPVTVAVAGVALAALLIRPRPPRR
jgi:cobalamin synthase